MFIFWLIRSGARLCEVGDEWEVAVTSLRLATHRPRLLAAGGKGVGKSTFVRWLSNRVLASGRVVYLDLDPGQREFGLPGYVSLAVLDSPLLGVYRFVN
jgi:polynucleotide 5'-hydroxyl-kinase GRC3/NOL9